jgi:hypothetical protein
MIASHGTGLIVQLTQPQPFPYSASVQKIPRAQTQRTCALLPLVYRNQAFSMVRILLFSLRKAQKLAKAASRHISGQSVKADAFRPAKPGGADDL